MDSDDSYLNNNGFNGSDEMSEDFEKFVEPQFCIELDPEQNQDEDDKPLMIDLTFGNTESNNNNSTTSSNDESTNVVSNNWPGYYLEINAKQDQDEMVQIVQNKDIPEIEKEELAITSADDNNTKNLTSNGNYGCSTSSTSSSSTSSNEVQKAAAVWQTYCVQNNIPIETEFMKNVENTQISLRYKSKLDATHPTLADLKNYATYPKSSIYDPSKKLTAGLKVICPSKPRTNPPITWFTKETIETMEIKRRKAIQSDRNYRLKRRIIQNQLVYRVAYLENINETLKAKIDEMSTVRGYEGFGN